MILSTNKQFNLESICHMTKEKVLIQLAASIKKTAILQMCRKIFNTGN